jgi:hypothetical protein
VVVDRHTVERAEVQVKLAQPMVLVKVVMVSLLQSQALL